MEAYQKSKQEILKELHTSESGLSTYEVEKRISMYGKNELPKGKKESLFIQFIHQFEDPMVVILIVASVISLCMKEFVDACIILFVIVMNAMIGVVQEYKAEKALEALQQLSSPQVHVKRDGKVQIVDSTHLVVGDIVELSAGNYVPADLRLLKSNGLQVEESTLTGESEAVKKEADITYQRPCRLHERKNMVFMSTFVTSGSGIGVVCASAKESEVGKVASLLEEENEDKTPLQKRLAILSKWLGILSLAVCFCMFVIYYLQGRAFFEILLLSISLAVAAIPEGLVAVVTIVLALGVQNMSKKNAIVRHLHAVETLGSVSVICSDKTGTLTLNKMQVQKVLNASLQEEIDEALCMNMALCNHVHIQEENTVGEGMEVALVQYASKYGYDKNQLVKTWSYKDEIPFDSTRKRMSVVCSNTKERMVYTKGAIEYVLPLCEYYYERGDIRLLTQTKREKIMQAAMQMSDEALRVLAFAMRQLHSSYSNIESKLVFCGIAGLMDPPRKEAKKSVEACKKAGIKVAMITGDNARTAYAIAKNLKIVSSFHEVLTGKEMDAMNDTYLQENIRKYRVFARVTPKDKVRIVQALKANGEVVAMSGDGVNDAPALKRADIGVAMGQNGTEVCKQSSDMILADDNFSTIVDAVEEGRNIYKNIQKAVLYLLSCNLGEIMALFLASVCMPYVSSTLNAVQILWVNLVTDSFPALALGVDPKDRFIMQEKPRDPKESLFANGGLIFTILNGMLIGTMCIVAFRYGYHTSEIKAQTMAFMVLSISQLFHALNLTSLTHSIFEVGIFKNTWLILTIVFGIVLQICVCSIPIFQVLLNTMSLSLFEWGIVFALSSMPIVLNEVSKWIAKGK